MPNVRFHVTVMYKDGTKKQGHMMGSKLEQLITYDAPNNGKIKFIAFTRNGRYVGDWMADR